MMTRHIYDTISIEKIGLDNRILETTVCSVRVYCLVYECWSYRYREGLEKKYGIYHEGPLRQLN